MNVRPAGPGGASLRKATFIGRLMSCGEPSARILTNAPLSISAFTMCKGMWPHPNPALRKACLAPRSAKRQVSGDNTPKFLPAHGAGSGFELVDVVGHRAGIRNKAAPFFGESWIARGAIEELYAKLRFQIR